MLHPSIKSAAAEQPTVRVFIELVSVDFIAPKMPRGAIWVKDVSGMKEGQLRILNEHPPIEVASSGLVLYPFRRLDPVPWCQRRGDFTFQQGEYYGKTSRWLAG